jgi:hypothetical protein
MTVIDCGRGKIFFVQPSAIVWPYGGATGVSEWDYHAVGRPLEAYQSNRGKRNCLALRYNRWLSEPTSQGQRGCY